jgi:hypothetical protein
MLILVLLLGVITNLNFAKNNPGGIDFLIPWQSVQLFIDEGLSPYSEEVTAAIQQRVYGRPADIQAGEPSQAFNYPFYAYLAFLPVGVIDDFSLARGIWMSVLMVSLAFGGLVAPNIIDWKVGAWPRVITALLAVTWYFGARTLIVGQVTGLVFVCILLALASIRAKQDVPAGVFLAFATVKPQMGLLVTLFVLIWALSRRRSGVLTGFLISLAFLTASSMLVMADWPLQFLRQFVRPDFVLTKSPLGLIAESFPGINSLVNGVLHIVALLYMLSEWYLALGKDSRWFAWTAMQTLVITLLLMPGPSTTNYVVLVPVLLLVFRIWQQRWGRFGQLMILVSALLFSVGLWYLFLATVQNAVESPLLLFPVPLFALFTLWWVRWWALRPAKLMLEDFADIMG